MLKRHLKHLPVQRWMVMGMVKLELTENEVLALKAVVYGCNKNKKLVGATYIEDIKAESRKSISFYDALIAIYSVIDSIEENGERREGE